MYGGMYGGGGSSRAGRSRHKHQKQQKHQQQYYGHHRLTTGLENNLGGQLNRQTLAAAKLTSTLAVGTSAARSDVCRPRQFEASDKPSTAASSDYTERAVFAEEAPTLPPSVREETTYQTTRSDLAESRFSRQACCCVGNTEALAGKSPELRTDANQTAGSENQTRRLFDEHPDEFSCHLAASENYQEHEQQQRLSIVAKIMNFARRTWLGLTASEDSELDELEGPTVHYRPEAIETLCRLTGFNRGELQLMYRGFKQECPSGMVKEETFKMIYSQFFPRGADASQYAHFVFNTFDQDNTGSITFTDFVIGLSVLSRGSLQEKLRWTFNLYDIDGDGYITKDGLSRIVKAVYDLMGRAVEPLVEEHTTREHVERVFNRLDLNKDGVVTIDEFMDSCTQDENISKSMAVLDTIL